MDKNTKFYLETASWYSDVMESQLELSRVLMQNEKALKLAISKQVSDINYQKTINFVVSHINVSSLKEKVLQKTASIMIFEGAWMTFASLSLDENYQQATSLPNDIRNKIIDSYLN